MPKYSLGAKLILVGIFLYAVYAGSTIHQAYLNSDFIENLGTTQTIQTAQVVTVSNTTTLTPVADIVVSNGNSNNGNNNAEYAISNLSTSGNPRQVFLRFDLANISGPVTSAKLRFYVINDDAKPVTVSAVASDTWQEATTLWSNKPVLGATLGTVSVATLNSYTQDFDVTANVEGQRQGDRFASFALSYPTSGGFAAISSKEKGNGAQLIVTYNTTSGSPTTPPPTAPVTQPTNNNQTTASQPVVPSNQSVVALEDYNLAFSTYLGGTHQQAGASSGGTLAFDYVRDVAVDNSGNIYVVGGTGSENFPTKPGTDPQALNDTSLNMGSCSSLGSYKQLDVFVAKLKPDGSLDWSTYLGGPCYDRAYAVELDNQGNIYVAGRAGEGFPTSGSVVQPNFVTQNASLGGYGQQNGFLAKFNNGGKLLWATYFQDQTPNPDVTVFRDIAVDVSGNVYAALTHYGAAKFNVTASGVSLAWKRPFIGNGSQNMITPSIRVFRASDGLDYPYIAGGTNSTNLPINGSAGAGYQTTFGGTSDFYLAKLKPDGSGVMWGTYVGGSDKEYSETHNLALDSQGNAYLAGTTKSDVLLPGRTATGFSSTYSGSAMTTAGGSGTNYVGDGFIVKVSALGQLLGATYLGGSGGEGIEGVSLDGDGDVYVSGATFSNDLLTNLGVGSVAYQSTNKGKGDLFGLKVSGDLTEIIAGTYLGGSGKDYGRSSVVGVNGDFYLVGHSDSNSSPASGSFPTTAGAIDTSHTNLDEDDGVLAKLTLGSTLPPSDTTDPTVSISAPTVGLNVNIGTAVTLSANASDNVGGSGMAGVQFKVNGNNVGSEDTSAPYSVSWPTTGLSIGAYQITAVARDVAGNTTTSAPVSVTLIGVGLPDTIPPSAPSNLTATAVSSTQINLSWTAATDNVAVAGYRVYVNGSANPINANLITGTTYQHTGLTPSTTYIYQVRAVDTATPTALVSTLSNVASATTQTAPPPSSTTCAQGLGNRCSGLAPLGVFFDATHLTFSGVAKPFHELEYIWDFKDPNASFVNRPDLDATKAIGAVAAHVFENPGVYNVTLTVKKNGVTIGQPITETVTVGAFTGITYYVSDSTGNDANSGLSPATPLKSYDFAMARLFSASGTVNGVPVGRRLLFKRGETFNNNSNQSFANGIGPYLVGAYANADGSDNPNLPKPLVQAGNFGITPINLGNASGTSASKDVRIVNISFKGLLGTHVGLFPGQNTLFFRSKLDAFRTGVSSSAVNKPNNYYIDSEFTNAGDYQIYLGPDSSNLSQNHTAIVANKISAVNADESIFRTWLTHSVISGNEISGSTPAGCGIKFLGGNIANNSANKGEYIIFADNIFRHGPGGVLRIMLCMGSGNNNQSEYLTDTIVERNYFDYGGVTAANGAISSVQADNATIRNNRFFNIQEAIAIERGKTGFSTWNNWKVYNNTFYHAINNTPTFFSAANSVTSTVNNLEIKNNIFQTNSGNNLTFAIDAPNVPLTEITSTNNVWYFPNGSTKYLFVTLADSVPTPINYSWSKQAGVGTAQFSNASSPDTTITLSTPGQYLIRVTASDGSRTTFDDFVIKYAMTPLNAFHTGAPVTTAATNVLSTPSGNSVGNQANNSKGTVIGGPTTDSNGTWWEVNFNSGPDGWVNSNFLSLTQNHANSSSDPSLSLSSILDQTIQTGNQITLSAKVYESYSFFTWVSCSLGHGCKDQSSFNSDPNLNSSNLTLTSASTNAINKATPINGLFQDFFRNARPFGPSSDIGAHEFGTPIACTPNWSCSAWGQCVGGNQTRTCTDLNNCGSSSGMPATSQTCTTGLLPDIAAPTVSLTQPLTGTLSGTVPMAATAVDPTITGRLTSGVFGVQFKANGNNINNEVTGLGPYGTSWDTTTFQNGSYNLVAVARDVAGNYATSTAVAVTVNNVPTDSTPPIITNQTITPVTLPNLPVLSVTTNEPATCRFSTQAGATFTQMSNFLVTGAQAHAHALSGLVANPYTYYVLCQDAAGNVSTPVTTITFTVTSAPPPTGSGISASRGTNGDVCVAPCAVFFDSNISNLSWSEIESTKFDWDFDSTGVDLTSTQPRTFNGYLAAHVYENPGLYTVVLTKKVGSQAPTIITQDVLVSPFSGTTYYVSSSSGVDSNQAGTQAQPFQSLSYAWTKIQPNTRILLKRGDSWNITSGFSTNVDGPVIIGSYGTGAKPKIIANYNDVQGHIFNVGRPRWVIMDLDVSGVSKSVGAITLRNSYFLAFRVDLDNLAQGFSGIGQPNNNISSPKFLDRFFVDFNVSNVNNTNYVTGKQFVLLNSDISLLNAEHVIRLSGSDGKTLVAGNKLTGTGTSKTVITTRGYEVAGVDPADHTLISGNTITGSGDISSLVTLGGGTGGNLPEHREYLIFEKNLVRFVDPPPSGPTGMDMVNGGSSHVAIRNNILLDNQSTHPKLGIVINWEFPYVNAPDDVSIYNNTVYTNKNSGAFMKLDDAPAPRQIKNVKLHNNIYYAPNIGNGCCDGVIESDVLLLSEITDTNNIWYAPAITNNNKRLFRLVDDGLQAVASYTWAQWQAAGKGQNSLIAQPNFVSQNSTTADDFIPSSSSVAIDHGSALFGAFHDFDNNLRPQGLAYDIGAYEFTDSTPNPTTYSLSITKQGSGTGTVSGGGLNCGTTCSVTLNSGTNVTLVNTPTAGHSFAGWSGDQDCADGIVNMSANRSCVATFNAPSNQSPTVNAGTDAQITLPTTSYSLNATVSDDGLPASPGVITTSWSRVSGPTNVTFANASAVDTTVSGLTNTGTYVLRLSADDDGTGPNAAVIDDIQITVNPAIVVDNTPPTILSSSPSGTLAVGTTQVNMQVVTNENATCKYGTASNTYANLPNTFTTTGGTNHSQTLSGLTPNSYTRYVRCRDTSTNLNFNTTDTIITFTIPNNPDTTDPSVPTNLQAVANSATQINVTWDASTDVSPAGQASSGVAGYRVYRLPDTSNPVGSPTTNSFSHTGLSPNTSYQYRVSAIDNASNVSNLSIASTAVTTPNLPDTAAPNITNTTQATFPAPTTQVAVSVTTNEPATCRIGQSDVAFGLLPANSMTAGAVSNNVYPHQSALISGLTPNTSHTRYVRCQDSLSNTNQTGLRIDFSIQADTTNPAVSILGPIDGSTISTAITVVANASDNVAVAGVQFKVGNTNLGSEDLSFPYLAAWTVSNLVNGSYTLHAVARDTSNNRATSTITVNVANNVPPLTDSTAPQISGLASSAITSNSATISWSTNEPAISNVLYGPTTAYGNTMSSASLSTNHSFNLTGLTANTTYHFIVNAVDASGNPSATSDNTFVTLTSPPPPPSSGGGGGGGGNNDNTAPGMVTVASAVAGDRQVVITWQNPNDNDFNKTLIARGTSPISTTASNPRNISGTTVIYDGNSEQFIDTGLTNGQTYYYALFTYDDEPNYSNGVSLTAIPGSSNQQNQTVATAGTGGSSSSSSAVSAPVSTVVLPIVTGPFAVGSTGEQVRILQQMLTLGNYYAGTPSAVYDSATVLAVQKFQQANGIVSSGTPTTTGYGLAGPSTRLVLNRLYAGKTLTITGLALPDLSNYQNLSPEAKETVLNTLRAIITELQKAIIQLLQRLLLTLQGRSI